MSQYLIDLFPLFLLLLLFYRAKPVRPLSGFNDKCLDLVPCRSLRGFLALFVILHHLSQQTAGGRIMPLFTYFGNLPVSVFFFLSGYGLMKRFITDRDYAKGFLLRRIPPIVVPFFFVLLVFRLLFSLAGEPVTFKYLFELILYGDPILVILWYMVVIFIFYIVFGLLMSVFPARPEALLLAMALFCGVFICLGSFFDFGQWWYNSCHLLIVGMVWALYEKRILSFIKRLYWPCLLLSGFVFLLLWQYFDAIFALWPTQEGRLVIALVRNTAFTLALVLFIMKLRLQNPLLDRLGKISLELYVLHPVFLFLFRSSFIHVGSDILYCLAVLAATIASAALLSRPYEALCRYCSGLFKN